MAEERHRGVCAGFRDAAVALSILFGSPCFGSVPGTLVGDCDEDAQVTVNEVVSCVNIALGFRRLESCLGADPNEDGVVGVDELVEAIGDSLGNPTPTQTATPTSSRTPSVTPTPPTSKPTQALSGNCMRPGASGLVGCQAGTTVSAFRCDDRATCAGGSSGRTLIATDDVDGSGSFSIDLGTGNNENAVLVLEADVGATRYRTITFGSVGPGTTSTASGGVTRGIAETTTIDPISEASVRILDDTARPPDSSEAVAGLPLFQVEELDRVNEEVRLANAGTVFGGSSDSGAVEIARETADSPEFQIDVVRESLNTFIRTDRGCQETGQFPVYGSEEPIAVTYRVDDLFGGESVTQAAVKITFLSGLTLLEEDVSTDDPMDGQLLIVGSFTLDATLLLTAEANGVQVTTGCRIRYDGTAPVATPNSIAQEVG